MRKSKFTTEQKLSILAEHDEDHMKIWETKSQISMKR